MLWELDTVSRIESSPHSVNVMRLWMDIIDDISSVKIDSTSQETTENRRQKTGDNYGFTE